MKRMDLSKRQFLRHGLLAMGAFIGNAFLPSSMQAALLSLATKGDLQIADENGVRLPLGFKSRIVARSGQILFNYQWHAAPDGGAVFATDDNGWIYVSNSEMEHEAGGVGALRFDHNGKIARAAIPRGRHGFLVKKWKKAECGSVILLVKMREWRGMR